MFFRFLGIALVNGVLLWLTYIALEPFVRRRWPESMISWTRLMSGRVRDPLVGSHILLGASMGILFALLAVVERLVPGWLGWAPPTPSTNPALQTLATARWAAAGLLDLVIPTIVIPMSILVLLVLFRVLLRKQWLAIGVFVVLFSTVNALPADYFWIFLAYWVVGHSMFVFVLFRYGIVAASSSVFFAILAGSNPLFLDLSLWYAGGPLFGLALAVGIVVYAFYTSLAGRRLLENVLAEA